MSLQGFRTILYTIFSQRCLIYNDGNNFLIRKYILSFADLDQTQKLTLYLLVSSADNLCKQLGSRSGPTFGRAWSGSKLFDILMVFLKEFFETTDYEKYQQTTKSVKSLSMQRIKRKMWNIFSRTYLLSF